MIAALVILLALSNHWIAAWWLFGIVTGIRILVGIAKAWAQD